VYSVLFGICNLMISPHSGGSQVGLIQCRAHSLVQHMERVLSTKRTWKHSLQTLDVNFIWQTVQPLSGCNASYFLTDL
jgi:hypothetical protein